MEEANHLHKWSYKDLNAKVAKLFLVDLPTMTLKPQFSLSWGCISAALSAFYIYMHIDEIRTLLYPSCVIIGVFVNRFFIIFNLH